MSTSPGVLLDTHVWFRFQVRPEVLRPAALDAIDEAAARNAVYVSVVSVWELAMLERDGKLATRSGMENWIEEALSKPGIGLLPLTREVALAAVALPEPMHKDPADRFLVATARIDDLILVTSEKAILAFAKTSKLAHLRA